MNLSNFSAPDSTNAAQANILQSIFEHLPFICILLDKSLTVKKLNAKAQNFDSYYLIAPLQENQALADCLQPTQRAYLIALCQQALQGNQVVQERFIINEQNTTKNIWLEFQIIPMKEKGLAEHLLCCIREITDKKENQQTLNRTIYEKQVQIENMERRNRQLQEQIHELELSQNNLYGLQQSLQAIFNSGLMGIIVFDRSFRIVHINRKAYADAYILSGVKRKIGDSVLLIIEEADRKVFLESTQQTLTGKTVRGEKRLSHRGKEIWIDMIYTPLYQKNQTQSEFVVFGSIDISERKRSEMDLMLSKEQLQLIFDSLDDVFWSFDIAKQKLLLLSPAFEKLFGYSAQDFVRYNGSLNAIVHHADRQMYQQAFERAANAGETVAIEYRVYTVDGLIKWVHSYIKPYFGNSIKYPTLLQGITTDITKRKEAEKALLESERNFRSIFEQAAAGIVQLNLYQQITHANTTFAKMLGKTKNDLKNLPFTQLLHPDSIQNVQEATQKVLKQQTTMFRQECKLLAQDEHIVWSLLTISLVKDTNEKPKYLLGILQNISELKKTQEDLNFKKAELDTLIYRTPHDLRGPVATLKGLSDLMQAENQNEHLHDYLLKLQKTLDELDNRLHNLMEITNIKEITIAKTKINFQQIFEEICLNLWQVPKHNQIPIITDFSGVKDFYSDVNLLKIILHNLLSNAMQFARPNVEPYVMLRIQQNQEHLKIEVEDNGEGINPEALPKIYNMFFRASENSKGAGLGLYLLKNALDKLGGTIQVESKVGRGCKFVVFL